jgi:hypothetical protein
MSGDRNCRSRPENADDGEGPGGSAAVDEGVNCDDRDCVKHHDGITEY